MIASKVRKHFSKFKREIGRHSGKAGIIKESNLANRGHLIDNIQKRDINASLSEIEDLDVRLNFQQKQLSLKALTP